MNARIFSLDESAKKLSAERLLSARAAAGFRSARSAAIRFGWTIPTYGAHENGTNGFSPSDAQKYGDAFNVNWKWLMLLSEQQEPEVATHRPLSLDRVDFQAAARREEIPVYDAAAGGTGHLIISVEPSEYVEAPPPLRNVNGAYGIRITGDSMAPEYADGSIAFVIPVGAKRVGRPHIFYDHDPKTGEAQAIIKIWRGETSTKWKVAQTNPAKDFTIDKVDWPICHFVAAGYN